MEEKILVKIYRNCEPEVSTEYLRLSNNEFAFLKWLFTNGYFDIETEFETIEELPAPIEF